MINVHIAVLAGWLAGWLLTRWIVVWLPQQQRSNNFGLRLEVAREFKLKIKINVTHFNTRNNSMDKYQILESNMDFIA